jgi:hypothetical protein
MPLECEMLTSCKCHRVILFTLTAGEAMEAVWAEVHLGENPTHRFKHLNILQGQTKCPSLLVSERYAPMRCTAASERQRFPASHTMSLRCGDYGCTQFAHPLLCL